MALSSQWRSVNGVRQGGGVGVASRRILPAARRSRELFSVFRSSDLSHVHTRQQYTLGSLGSRSWYKSTDGAFHAGTLADKSSSSPEGIGKWGGEYWAWRSTFSGANLVICDSSNVYGLGVSGIQTTLRKTTLSGTFVSGVTFSSSARLANAIGQNASHIFFHSISSGGLDIGFFSVTKSGGTLLSPYLGAGSPNPTTARISRNPSSSNVVIAGNAATGSGNAGYIFSYTSTFGLLWKYKHSTGFRFCTGLAYKNGLIYTAWGVNDTSTPVIMIHTTTGGVVNSALRPNLTTTSPVFSEIAVDSQGKLYAWQDETVDYPGSTGQLATLVRYSSNLNLEQHINADSYTPNKFALDSNVFQSVGDYLFINNRFVNNPQNESEPMP